MCFIRKALDWLFTRHELKWLDDIMPESHKREKEEKKKMKEALIDEDAVCEASASWLWFIVSCHVPVYQCMSDVVCEAGASWLWFIMSCHVPVYQCMSDVHSLSLSLCLSL